MQPDIPQHREGKFKTGGRCICANFAAIAAFAGAQLGLAFIGPAQGETVRGSPLDTIMSTHLFADVPEAKDFVRESRPPAESLDFQPLTGPDRDGPKLKTKDELKALESELETAAARNEQVARKRLGFKKPVVPRTSQPQVKSGD